MIKVANNLQQLMVKQANLSELIDTRGERAAAGGLAGAVAAPLIAKLFKDKMTLGDYLSYGLLGGGLGFGGTALTEEAMDQIAKARAAFEKAPHGDPTKFKQEVEERIKNMNKGVAIT